MKRIFTLILAIAILVTAPLQTMAGSISQTDAEMQLSEQKIGQIIDDITRM